MTEKHCSRCGLFTDRFYPTQKYICIDCVGVDRKKRYNKKGRKHLRVEKSCKECGTKDNLVKNGFYKDGTQRYSNTCRKCNKDNNKWNEENKDKISKNRKASWAKMQDSSKANSKTLVRKWHYETKEVEKHRFDYWLECNEHKKFLVFDRFFRNNILREDLI